VRAKAKFEICLLYSFGSGRLVVCVFEEVRRRETTLTVCELFGYSQVKFFLPPLLVQKANDRSEYLCKNVKLGLNNMTEYLRFVESYSQKQTRKNSVLSPTQRGNQVKI
jgi:hypothetical protein